MEDKLKQLIDGCKCGIFININEHRDYYDSAEEALEEAKDDPCPPDIDEDVRKIMIETNTIVKCQFYPYTPIGSYEVWHYDLDKCLDECLTVFIK